MIDLPLVIVHVSGREAMEQIRWAHGRGLKILAETCPQYITLTAADLQAIQGDGDPMRGAKYVCSRPPRDRLSQAAIWDGRLPVLFSEGVSKGRISLSRFVALTATNHAKICGLYPGKGVIAVGFDADIALWDATKRVKASRSRAGPSSPLPGAISCPKTANPVGQPGRSHVPGRAPAPATHFAGSFT